MDLDLKILVIAEDPARAALLKEGVNDAGLLRVEWLANTSSLCTRIMALDPDVVLIDLQSPSQAVLEQMFDVSRKVKRPIAMFVDESNSGAISDSVEAGVSTFIVGGLAKERIKPILDMTISRFKTFSRLQRELEDAKIQLEERKVIERAKGILIKQKGISEEQAYTLLRRNAMNQKKKISEIAAHVVSAADLLS